MPEKVTAYEIGYRGQLGKIFVDASFYSNDYDLEIREQAEARNHRIGTEKKVTYVDLICEGTVDENIIKSLRSKINIATEIMGEQFKEWLI